MPKFSVIPNRTVITLSIDSKKREECKEKGMNISLILDAALERELDPDRKENYEKARENKLTTYKDYIQTTKQEEQLDNFIENVVEKKPEQKNRSFVRSDTRNWRRPWEGGGFASQASG